MSDSENAPIGGYLPVLAGSIIAGIVYLALTIALLWRVHLHRGLEQRRFGTFLWPLILGCGIMVLGFIFRAVYRYETSLGIYILQTLFILLAPIFFLWGLYRSIGELGQALGEEVSRKCLLLKPHRIARIFVSVDIVTFWVQAGGGGLSVNADLAETGKWIALVGLIIQLIALSCFLIMTTTFGLRVRSNYPSVWRYSGSNLDWRVCWVAIIAFGLCLMVRCVFRCIEYSQGYDGYLITHEIYLYVLDALPCAIAILLFLTWWPPLYMFYNQALPTSMPLKSSDSSETSFVARKPSPRY